MVEIHLPSWELSSQRCPVCNDYELIFCTCSSCGRLVLACDLCGMFEIAKKSVGAKFYKEDCCAAPNFRDATWQEIRALGFGPDE